MSVDLSHAFVALNRRFLLDYPRSAALQVARMPRQDAATALGSYDTNTLTPFFSMLATDVAADLLLLLPDELATGLLSELLPGDATRFVSVLEETDRDRLLSRLDVAVGREIGRLLSYPPGSAGQMMDTRVVFFPDSAAVSETLDRLRRTRAKASRSLFVVNDDNQLSGRVTLQELALAEPDTRLSDLISPVSAVVSPLSSRDEVAGLLDRHSLIDLPVIDIEGRPLGIIYHDTLVQAIQENATTDIQTMVGASRDERALSPTLFAVRKRLPWLQVNLLTAFLAASVVGLFEDTIARFTALAVLLPVVAGQSGNAGAQALAVTMRGLALREVNLRQWWRVTLKEVRTGLINGLAVAFTCGIGVYFWSGSAGLVLVIAVSMVLAMVAAGFAGALVPMGLTRFGQDPAQASSIILTTVTDIAGFFSFLGIATALASML